MRRLDTDEFVRRSKATHGDRYDYTETKYKNNHEDVQIRCSIHGVFYQSPGSHMGGANCSQCALGDHWSHGENQFLLDRYVKDGGPFCAAKLDRSIKSIHAQARRLGLAIKRKLVPVHPEIPRFFWMRLLSCAEVRDLEVQITSDDVWDCYERLGRRCALTGWSVIFDGKKGTTASVDRIDSARGYLKDNIQIVHKDVNRSKWASSDVDFYAMCKAVHENRSHDMEQDVIEWECDTANDTVRPVRRRVLVTDGLC